MMPVFEDVKARLDELRKEIAEEPAHRVYDPWHGQFELYRSDACNYEVLDDGVWYKIDASHLGSRLYRSTSVPENVLARARAAVAPFVDSSDCNPWTDPRPFYSALLGKEFDGVRFINMTYEPTPAGKLPPIY